MSKSTNKPNQPKPLTLEEMQAKRKGEVSGTKLSGLYSAMTDFLAENIGKVFDSTELGAAFGQPKSDTRHAFQRVGKLSADNLAVVAHPSNPKIWIHLVKLSGNGRNRNGYTATKAGDAPKT